MPKRIQRKRTKGWKMPQDSIYVGRPTKWGNPLRVVNFSSRIACVEAYRKQIVEYRVGEAFRIDIKRELRGKDLVCWCRLDQSCHADVLLEIANN